MLTILTFEDACDKIHQARRLLNDGERSWKDVLEMIKGCIHPESLILGLYPERFEGAALGADVDGPGPANEMEHIITDMIRTAEAQERMGKIITKCICKIPNCPECASL